MFAPESNTPNLMPLMNFLPASHFLYLSLLVFLLGCVNAKQKPGTILLVRSLFSHYVRTATRIDNDISNFLLPEGK